MNKDSQFDKVIKDTLSDGEENIILDTAPLERAKLRLKSSKFKFDISNVFIRLKHPLIGVCSLVFILALLVAFEKPIRVMAEKSFIMMYTAVKGEDGKYKTVQVPADENDFTTSIGVKCGTSDEEISERFGHAVKIPKELDGGYKIEKRDPYISQCLETKTLDVNAWYSKDRSRLMVLVDEQDLIKDAKENGDSLKEIKIGNKTAYYAEFPHAIYPFIPEEDGGTFDVTQKPLEIRTIHSVTWEQNGVFYRVWDLDTGDSTAEIVEKIAKMVMDYQQ